VPTSRSKIAHRCRTGEVVVVALAFLLGLAFALAVDGIAVVVDPIVDGRPGYRSAII